MPAFEQIVTALKKEEHQLVAQLDRIRTAISALSVNGAGSVPASPTAQAHSKQAASPVTAPRQRKMSAAARKAVSQRMTKYWAARRKAKKA